jgi:hypothetical protein
LVVFQPDGAADDLEIVAAVSADDQHFGRSQTAGDGSDDRVYGLAVLDLSSGSLGRRALSC